MGEGWGEGIYFVQCKRTRAVSHVPANSAGTVPHKSACCGAAFATASSEHDSVGSIPWVPTFSTSTVMRGLAVEIDGYQHTDRAEHDRERTQYLKQVHGITVIRFTNADINTNMEGVLLEIRARLYPTGE